MKCNALAHYEWFGTGWFIVSCAAFTATCSVCSVPVRSVVGIGCGNRRRLCVFLFLRRLSIKSLSLALFDSRSFTSRTSITLLRLLVPALFLFHRLTFFLLLTVQHFVSHHNLLLLQYHLRLTEYHILFRVPLIRSITLIFSCWRKPACYFFHLFACFVAFFVCRLRLCSVLDANNRFLVSVSTWLGRIVT